MVEHMAAAYCQTLSIETEHLPTQEQVDWIASRFEHRNALDPIIKRRVLQCLVEADQFERFLAEKFPATKRFLSQSFERIQSAI